MRTAMRLTALAMVPAALLLDGCAAFRASTHDVDVNDTKHFGASYDYSDMRMITEEMGGRVVGEFLGKQPAAPIMMVAGIENRTTKHIDTKNITDRIRDIVFKSGKAQFVNEARRADLLKEQGYQAANATPETQARVGRQLGAKYMLSGSLVEMESQSPRQVRVSKQELKYYKLTFEVTDLETGLLAWTGEKEFARQASLPLIGW